MPTQVTPTHAGGGGVAAETLFSDVAAARSMSGHLDDLVLLCQVDAELHKAVLKFQMEHAAAAASYEPESTLEQSDHRQQQRSNAKCHLEAALVRMLDLAVLVASTVMRRAMSASSRAGSRTSGGSGKSPLGSPAADPAAAAGGRSLSPLSDVDNMRPPQSLGGDGGMGYHSSSVDDLSANCDAARTRDAEAIHHAIRVAATVFIVAEDLCSLLQAHGLRHGLLDVCRTAICMPRLTELQYFAEGFKTDHMAVLSNFTFENAEVCDAVAQDDALLAAILGATRIDEENPGMVEWAEFCVRNVCSVSHSARDKIAAYRRTQSGGPLTTPHAAVAL